VWRVGLSLLVGLIAACAGDEAVTVTTTHRDSAGVAIVESAGLPPLNGGGWSVDTIPFLSIGTVEGEEAYELMGVVGAHRSGDGTIAVLDNGTTNVRVFDGSGVHLRTIGREGQGPGEFRTPHLAGFVGHDTLVIIDQGNDRFTLVHPVDGFIRQSGVSDEVIQYLYALGVFSDGSILFAEDFEREDQDERSAGLHRGVAVFRSCTPDGELDTDFGRFRGSELWLEVVEREDLDPFVRHAVTRFGKRPQAAVARDLFFLGEQDAIEIKVHRQTGELVKLIRFDWEPVAVTEELNQIDIEERIATYARNENIERNLRRAYADMEEPEYFPAHGRLVADGLGFLWVQEYRLPGEGEPAWLVFDPDGRLAARVSLPEGLGVFEIGADYVLGEVRDELDVEYVQLFALSRPT
jgi:hypothetical protein